VRVSAPEQDPFVRDIRERITELDSGIIDALNRRIELVAELKRYKEEHGISFLDPDRERRMLDHQSERNAGPLSDEGLRAFYAELLALTKREVE
jgi:chorismate mutase/prephenate dehydratase